MHSVYVSAGYAWSNEFRNNPPEVPVENNHVGSYRKDLNRKQIKRAPGVDSRACNELLLSMANYF
jgi:hypothetical protein